MNTPRRLSTLTAGCVTTLAMSAAAQTTKIASVGTGGILPECGASTNFCYSINSTITPDGRYVAFASTPPNLVPGPQLPPPHSVPQILIHNRQTCTTWRISETPAGLPADKPCNNPSITADGQVVSFTSRASNLAPGVPTLVDQVYVYEESTGAVTLISKAPDGTPGNSDSGVSAISADGRWITFQSSASNLVANDTNGQPDIFIYDRQTSTMRRANISASGVQADGATRRPSMTANGRFVVFDSTAQNLSTIPFSPSSPQVFLLDRDMDTDGIFDEPGQTSLTMVSVNNAGQPANGFASWGVASPDGSLVVFSGSNSTTNLVTGDTNGATDIFMRDLQTNQTTRESVGPGGAQSNAGSYFPFHISEDNRYLSFHSASQTLVEGGHNGVTHILRRDLSTGENIVISRTSAALGGDRGAGDFADSSSEAAFMTPNGNTIVFASAASNLHPGFNNDGWVNVYVRSLRPADLDGDDIVNVFDLLSLLAQWGGGHCSIGDIDGDGVVNVFDLLGLLADWG